MPKKPRQSTSKRGSRRGQRKRIKPKKAPPANRGGGPVKARSAVAATTAVAAAATIAVAAAAQPDEVVFRLEWKGGPARLIELVDNEVGVAIADPSGPVWTYRAAPDPGTGSHFIQWHLLFPGQTLTALKAFAKRNGGAEQLLNKSDREEQDWTSDGELV
jgi:hypothetical protein